MMSNYRYFIVCLMVLFFLIGCQKKNKKTYPTIGYLEKLDARFDQIVSPKAKIEVLSTGHNWTEGPVWVPKKQWLLYSDVPMNIAYKWSEEMGVKEFLSPSGYSGTESADGSNGLILDHEGNLILCKSGDREIARLTNLYKEEKPIFETLTNEFNGEKYNSPNDIVMDKQGNFYFTDPNYNLRDKTKKEMDYQGVFKVTPKGEVFLLTKKYLTPNGIGLSPDEKILYIANSRPSFLYAWDIENNKISNERVLFDANELWEKSKSKQPPDGMAVNKKGIIFLAGPDGVLIISPQGEHLGTIKTDKLTSNCTFNEDESVLYVTCDDLVLRVILHP